MEASVNVATDASLSFTALVASHPRAARRVMRMSLQEEASQR